MTSSGTEIFHYGRRLGKTTELAKRVASDPSGIMLVPRRQMARYIADNHPNIRDRIFAVGEINGWYSLGSEPSRMRDLSKFNLYIDEAGDTNEDLLYNAHEMGNLKAIAFTTYSFETKNIIRYIIDKNKKTYYHKSHDEHSQIYRRITRFEPSARAELMPGNMLRR